MCESLVCCCLFPFIPLCISSETNTGIVLILFISHDPSVKCSRRGDQGTLLVLVSPDTFLMESKWAWVWGHPAWPAQPWFQSSCLRHSPVKTILGEAMAPVLPRLTLLLLTAVPRTSAAALGPWPGLQLHRQSGYTGCMLPVSWGREVQYLWKNSCWSKPSFSKLIFP